MDINIGDMFYGYSTIGEIKEKGEYGGVVTTIMKYLLEEGIVDGVVVVRKGFDIYDAVPTFITNPKDVINSAGSIYCGTLNIAKFLVKYLEGARNKKVAIVVKPCDAKIIRELMKKGVIIEDNVIMIGLNCGGSMSPVPTRNMIKDVFGLNPNEVIKIEIINGKLIIKTSDEEKAIKIEELETKGVGRRETCQRCDMKIPKNADLALGNWGIIDNLTVKLTFIEVCSNIGADILDKMQNVGEIKLVKPVEKAISIRENINKLMLKKSAEKQEEDFKISSGDIIETWKAFEDEFSRCMKCYSCREACPLCFCEDCCLEAKGPEWVPGGFIPGAPLFHLTRMVHTVDACINCGQCSEVCPCEISVAKLWNIVNNKVKKVYGYESGKKDYNYIPFTEYPLKK